MKPTNVIVFRVEEGRLVPLLVPVEHVAVYGLEEEDLAASPNLRLAVRRASKRLMAVTHGLSDPGDQDEQDDQPGAN